jgi:hypothetical protein
MSEQNTSHGKCMEYFYYPWMKETDTIRKMMKIRILITDLKKVDMIIDGQRKKMDHGDIKITIDGFVEYDYENRWYYRQLFIFIRTLYIKYFYKNYSKYFEKLLIDECHGLYDMFERFFNMYKGYKQIKEGPHFYY